MNNSSGSCFYPDLDFNYIIISTLPISAVSLLPSLATVILVCALKLHKTLVYRLALYQVLSAMEFSVVWITASVCSVVLSTTRPIFNETTLISETVNVETIFEALLLGSAFIKLMFTVWIVIHLFALAVFHKNLQRLEPLYVVSSLLVPLVVTAALLGLTLQEACSLMAANIVYTIIFTVLVLTSLLIVVMGTILCHRACRRRSLALSEYDKQHKKALYEMLPLLLYPILFLLITTPIFVSGVLNMQNVDMYTYTMYIYSDSYVIFTICAPLWSFTTSLLLIFHLCVVRHVRKQNLQRIKNALHKVRLHREAEEGSVTVNETTRLCQRSDTHFTLPVED